MRLLFPLIALLALAFVACSDEAETGAPAGSTLASRTPTPASRTATPATNAGTATAAVAPGTTGGAGTPAGSTAEPADIQPTDTATPTAIAPPNPGGSSGISGVALAGPQCPVERLDSPCPDRPVANAAIDVYNGDRTTKVTTVTTDADGRFRVDLPPGDYYLDPQPPDASRPFPIGTPQTVSVQPGEYTDVTVSYDTGIR